MNGFSEYISVFYQHLLTSKWLPGTSSGKEWTSGTLWARLSTSICDFEGGSWAEVSGNAYESQEMVGADFTSEIYPDPELGTVGLWLSGNSVEFPRATPTGWGLVPQLGIWTVASGGVVAKAFFAGAELAGPPTVDAGERIVFLSGASRSTSALVLKITTTNS